MAAGVFSRMLITDMMNKIGVHILKKKEIFKENVTWISVALVFVQFLYLICTWFFVQFSNTLRLSGTTFTRQGHFHTYNQTQQDRDKSCTKACLSSVFHIIFLWLWNVTHFLGNLCLVLWRTEIAHWPINKRNPEVKDMKVLELDASNNGILLNWMISEVHSHKDTNIMKLK